MAQYISTLLRPFTLARVMGTVNLVTVSSSAISNQLIAGLIIERHIKSILHPSLLLRVYGPMRSLHKALQGVVTTSFGGT